MSIRLLSKQAQAQQDTLGKIRQTLAGILPQDKADELTNLIGDYVSKQRAAAEQELRRQLPTELAGYGTLPTILAVLGSFVSKEPFVPILLALGGLALTAMSPGLREKVNFANWYKAIQQKWFTK